MEAGQTPAAGTEPTPAQAAAVAQAGAAAATAPGQTPDQAQAAAAAATREKADELNVKLSDEDVDKIAKHTITLLEQAGAFDQPPAPVATSPAAAGEAQAATAAGADSTPAPAAPAPTGDGTPATEPRKRSFAEKFQGKR